MTITDLSRALGLRLTLGYIGNTGRNRDGSEYDERLWMVWVNGVKVKATGNTLSIISGNTSDIEALIANADLVAIHERIARLWRANKVSFTDLKGVWGDVTVKAEVIEDEVIDFVNGVR